MPKYSGVTFTVRPVEEQGKVSGYVASGFLTKKHLAEFRNLVDSPDYKRSRVWRGEYMEMAQAIVKAVDKVLSQGSSLQRLTAGPGSAP